MLKIKPKFFTLRTKMAILSFGSVFLAILIGGIIVVDKISATFEKEAGMRAMAIARTLAQFEEIKTSGARRQLPSSRLPSVLAWPRVLNTSLL